VPDELALFGRTLVVGRCDGRSPWRHTPGCRSAPRVRSCAPEAGPTRSTRAVGAVPQRWSGSLVGLNARRASATLRR